MKRFILLTVTLASTVLVSAAIVGTAVGIDGKALYDAKCAACHGAGGEGTGMLAPLKGSDYLKKASGEEIKKVIMEGTTTGVMPMPAMKDKIGDKEADAIVEYLKGLKP